ncbi:hypothetical protein [Priestia megaterium]|uniref:hypothetical protein n=1 Tax=Priestia megaterium TaxID=1404 RepID=UPI000BF463DE|nr:hypothetical protein [Priestia megaterium]PFW43769.1 hypothetical protein COL17_26540 [Priestia megaterium]
MNISFLGKYELMLEIKLDRSEFLVYANNVDNEIHMVDLGKEGTQSLTNAMHVNFINDLMTDLPYDFKQRFELNMSDIRYFWIGVDKVATEFVYATDDLMTMNKEGYEKMVPVLFKQFLN